MINESGMNFAIQHKYFSKPDHFHFTLHSVPWCTVYKNLNVIIIIIISV